MSSLYELAQWLRNKHTTKKESVVMSNVKDAILEEAVELVRATPAEQLLETFQGDQEALVEPEIEGDTSFGVNPAWLEWFVKKNKKNYKVAIKVSKRLLREKKLKQRVERHRVREHKPFLERQH